MFPFAGAVTAAGVREAADKPLVCLEAVSGHERMAASVVMQDVAAWLKGVAGAIAPQAYVVSPGDAAGGMEVGDLEELTLSSGEIKPVKVIAVDTISYPPRVKVKMVDDEGQTTDEILVVPVLNEEDAERIQHQGKKVMVDHGQTTVYQDYEDSFNLHNDVGNGFQAIHSEGESEPPDECNDADEHDAEKHPTERRTSGTEVGQAILQGVSQVPAAGAEVGQSILREVSQEWQLTVQDVREKGAVGALRDAALDVIDSVGDAAGFAADKARALMPEKSATPRMAKLPNGITVTLGPLPEQN